MKVLFKRIREHMNLDGSIDRKPFSKFSLKYTVLRRKSITKLLFIVLVLAYLNEILFQTNLTHTSSNTSSSNDPSIALAVKSKVFDEFPREIPCVPNKNPDKFDTGLIYIKLQKCSSTTVAKIFLRLMRKIGNAKQSKNKCKSHTKHGFAWTLPLLNTRDKEHSFLFTFIREPTSRFVSDFFYHGISKSGNFKNNFRDFKRFLDNNMNEFPGYGGYMLPYLLLDKNFVPPISEKHLFWHPDDPNVIQNHELLEHRVKYVLDSYDFIGLTERLDESMIALSFILNIEIKDLLYAKEMRAAGSWDFDGNRKKCFFLQKSDLIDETKNYLTSHEWKARIAGDNLLYQSVNASLDLTIAYFKKKFGDDYNNRLKLYHKLMDLTKERCGSINCTKCSTTGEIIHHRDPRCATCIS